MQIAIAQINTTSDVDANLALIQDSVRQAAAEGARLEVGRGLGGAGTGVAVHWGGSTLEAARGVLPAAEGRMDA